MTKEDYNLYRKAVRGEADFPVEFFKKIFWRPCKRFDPEKATNEEIRKYFLEEHNKEGKEWCNVVEAVVTKILSEEKVLIRRTDNNREIEAYIDMKETPKINEKVAFHIDGIVDKL